MAKIVAVPMKEFSKQVFVQGVEPWTALVRAFCGHGRGPILQHTPVCMIFKVRIEEQVEVVCRQLTYSNPMGLPWGVRLTSCGRSNDQCLFNPGDLRWNPEKGKKLHKFIKIQCMRCGWRSTGWIQRPDWIHAFAQDSLQHFFWTNFPLAIEHKEFLKKAHVVPAISSGK
jgi:hypothetical protein